MKRFIKRIAFWGLLALTLNVLVAMVVYSLRHDDYYEDYEVCLLMEKQEALFEKGDSANTVFIGTSKTHRQIIPTLFDSLVPGAYAFNLGQGSLTAPRNLDFTNHLLEKKSDFKAIFLELAVLDRMLSNYQSDPVIQYMSPYRYALGLDYALHYKNIDWQEKWNYFKYYSLAFFYKYLGFSSQKRIKLLLNIPVYEPEQECAKFDVRANRGFYAVDQDLREHQGADLKSRRKSFLQNPLPQGLYVGAKTAKKIDASLFNQEFRTNLKNWKKNNIPVYFILPPRAYKVELYVLEQLKAIAQEEGFPVLDFSDPKQYPELYQVANSFDNAHLNYEGAKIYTRLIAEKYASLKK
ncbi:MAG TPA: hypothetical protein PKA00_13350 [Saprospiraceae bacterium]|nr:hypothetical protein [Saprospiraceae bacterium]HMQ83895.1 hypothetical protein [Saprospiraceae bacterium]